MNKKIFSEIKQKIERRVARHRLREAFSEARSLAETMMSFEASDALQRAEETYRQMLRYATTGADDPQRPEMTAQLGEAILATTDSLERSNLIADEPTLYYNVARFERTRAAESLAVLLTRYKAQMADTSLFDLVAGSRRREDYTATMRSREELERRLFNKVWTTHPLSGSDFEALSQALSGDAFPPYMRTLLTWAVTLGSLQYYDPRRLELLMASRLADNETQRAAALVGLLLALNAARGRYMPKRVRDRLEALKETPEWSADTELAYKELTRTRDTDRITAKIHNEVVPEMMKLRPEIKRRFTGELPTDPEELEENPEWQELLDKSGVADKLKEMSEIQEEGGDVMMGTFSHLKTFPFFHEAANWFLPFHTERTEFAAEDNTELQPVADIVSAMPMLCDSDKYSMMLSVTSAPAQQRRMLMQQLNAQMDQFNELRQAILTTELTDRRQLLRTQVQNLFRFYRLYRRKGEFPSPFAGAINLSGIPGLENLAEPALMQVICEFYFSHGYYEEGLQIAETSCAAGDAIPTPNTPEYLLVQRMGYACMKLGRYDEALRYLDRILLTSPEKTWVLKNAARCMMQTGDFRGALRHLQTVAAQPGNELNASLSLSIGHCHLELEEYDAAVKAYFKAEYLGANPRKVFRQLSWALLMNGDAAQARKYLQRAMEQTRPIANDFLNLGHIALSQRDFQGAATAYRRNITERRDAGKISTQQAVDDFIADMTEDTPALRHLGVDTDLLPLLTDSLLYTLDE